MKYGLKVAKERRAQAIEAETHAQKAVVTAMVRLDYEAAAMSLALAAQIRGTVLVWDAIIAASSVTEPSPALN